MRSEANSTLRMRTTDDENLCGLLMTPPVKPGPFRQFGVRIIPVTWTQEECDKYFQALLAHWTSYARRMQIQAFLIDSLDVKPDAAGLAAIAIIAGIETNEVFPDPELDPWQPDLLGTAKGPIPDEMPTETVYPIVPSGYIKLQVRGDAFYAHVSVPLHADYGGGFAAPLTGYLRPVSGRVEQALALLTGVPFERSDPEEPEQPTLLKE